MEESVQRIYGPAGDEMVGVANRIAEATGYMNTELMQSEVIFGNLAGQVGLSAQQVAKLTELASDIAHTTGIDSYRDDIAGVTQALMMGIQGSSWSMRTLGLRLDENYMKTQALGGAYKDTWAEMDSAARAQAYYASIMQQTADIQGAAADSQENYVTESRKAAAKLREAYQQLGEKLIPIATKILEFVNKIPTGVLTAGIAGAGVLGTAAALGGTMMMFRGMGGFGGLLGGLGGRGGMGGAVTSVAGEATGQMVGRSLGKGIMGALNREVTMGGVRSAFSSIGSGLTNFAATLRGANGGIGSLAGSIKNLGNVSVGTLGPLAALAAGVLLLTNYLTDIAKDTEEATNQKEAADERTQLLRYEMIQKQTGQDMRVIRDAETGKLRWAEQGEVAANTFAGWKYRQGYGFVATTAGGRGLTAEAAQWQRERQAEENIAIIERSKGISEKRKQEIIVTIQDQTYGGVHASNLDARSYGNTLQ